MTDFPTWLTHDEDDEVVRPCALCGAPDGDRCASTDRILVTGARNLKPVHGLDRHRVRVVLALAARLHPHATLLEGGARGVDALAGDFWERLGYPVETFPARWRQDGPAAGPIRNARMVASGATLGLAFPGPGSIGTWDCVRKMEAAGIPVQTFPLVLS